MQNADQSSTGTGIEQEANVLSVSTILREAREASGQSLEEVASQSRISRKYLEALEEGRFAALPGNTYILGFIRTYAGHMGLDGDELVNQYKSNSENATDKTTLDFPEPLPETGIPGGTILFAGIVVAVMAYGGWYVATEEDNSRANMVAAVPERLADAMPDDDSADAADQPADAEVVEMPTIVEDVTEIKEAVTEEPEEPQPVTEVPETVTETVTNVEETVEVAPEPEPEVVETTVDEVVEQVVVEEVEAEVETASPEMIVEDTTEALDEQSSQELNEAQLRELQESMDAGSSTDTSTTETAVVEVVTEVLEAESSPEVAAEPRAPRSYGEEGSSRILITAITNSWTEVRDTITGELLLTRLLHTGDTYNVPNRPGITLVTGNAGGLEIKVDGKVVPPIGGTGTVRHDVALDPEMLKSGKASE
ncbi:MAG: helix-turn-helix domain-containing protein [Rhodospirillales bacterium]|jgi:cytoskeleton protein RodZ|nr:helix-turn-helix domain-containing protein [Rhodospirillales bacterium]MBT5350706.1 helix-turn-helix domain-containing protein [Rhodospirillales bacterium]MBT5522068.1 helix-turn-helix domain-containing protein [Rhodospirillales bacterium]MBT6111510.1 helix-turn-helix domain-containing protein [Rhodospirillales bacterium]MBT6826419.1 helix-turn-helix domain-containing protein [Rhodospirillales bacterium]